MATTPPPPPPTQPDLNEVYRPEADPGWQSSFQSQPLTAEQILAMAGGEAIPAVPGKLVASDVSNAAPLDIFGDGPLHAGGADVANTGSMAPSALGLARTDPSIVYLESSVSASTAGARGLLDDLPPGVKLDENRSMKINLSMPSDAEGHQPAVSSSAPPTQIAPSVGDFSDSKGFGSEDLFGNRRDKSAMASFVSMLPDQVTQQIKATQCMQGTAIMAAVEEASEVHETQSEPLILPGQAHLRGADEGADMERRHTEAAVNRACEGKWVPSYMRQQLIENGHTQVPVSTLPNAHEYDSRNGPPTISGTFHEMAQELGESAQNLAHFMIAVISSLALQCQMCTHQTATTAHERVMVFGDSLCSDVRSSAYGEELVGGLSDEATAGYGPVRSRVRRTMQGVSFDAMLDTAKRCLVSPHAPPEFQRVVRTRQLLRCSPNPKTDTEDWTFAVEVNPEVLNQEAHQHISAGPLLFREQWHINRRTSEAALEISNAPSGSPMLVVLRIDINSPSGSDGPGCEVDSRLYARPLEHGAVLPPGLVEHLFEAHHHYSESLRDMILALLAEDPALKDATAAIAPTAQMGSPLPKVQWPMPDTRPPSWAAEDSRLQAPKQASRLGDTRIRSGMSGLAPGAVDESMLMKVADGI